MVEIAERLKPLYPVKLIVEGKQHFYQLDNDETWVPGVTSALGMLNKPALIPWAAKMVSENIKEFLIGHSLGRPLTKEEIETACLQGKNIYKKKASAATDVGSRAHKAIDDLILGKEPVITEDIKPCMDAYLFWKASNSLKIELGDTKIGSRLFGYGGGLDCLAFDKNNEAVLIDFKTSNGIWPEMAYQVAAYVQAFTETYGIRPKEALILRIGKDKPKFEVKRVSNLSVCLDGFLAALKLYKLQKYEKFEEAN